MCYVVVNVGIGNYNFKWVVFDGLMMDCDFNFVFVVKIWSKVDCIVFVVFVDDF